MTFLARCLALATALALLPGSALASPTTTPALASALQTVAVANDAGVAQALAQPTSTEVTVIVNGGASPAAAASPAPAPASSPAAIEPPPPTYVPSPYADGIRRDRKSGRGLLIGGLSLGITAYVYTSLAGALAIDKAREMDDDPITLEDESRARADRRAYGRALLVPGIGPALAIPKADTALRAWGAGMAGLLQASALAMTIVGIARLGRARRYERLERIHLGAVASSQGAHVSLGMRF